MPSVWRPYSNFRLGSSSGHLSFLAPAPTFRSFWLRRLNNLVPKIIEKTLYYLYNSLAPKTTCGTGTQVSSSGSTI